MFTSLAKVEFNLCKICASAWSTDFKFSHKMFFPFHLPLQIRWMDMRIIQKTAWLASTSSLSSFNWVTSRSAEATSWKSQVPHSQSCDKGRHSGWGWQQRIHYICVCMRASCWHDFWHSAFARQQLVHQQPACGGRLTVQILRPCSAPDLQPVRVRLLPHNWTGLKLPGELWIR